MPNTNDRIIGVDIAKIVAMILVVAVHVNGSGLPYVGEDPPGLGYTMLRSFLGAIFGACVDVFAIASGYVGIVSSFKLSRIIRLWIQVVFTGLAVLICLGIFTDVQVQPIDYIKACIPIAKEQYWYMTAYFMLCFVMPVLNAGIKALTEKELRYAVILLLGVICGESFVCSAGALGVNAGYSFEWLAVLYVIGAYIRLYNPLDKSKTVLFGVICLCAMIVGWVPMLLQNLTLFNSLQLPRLFEFGGYTSPFTVMIALCIFGLCLKVSIVSERARRVIGILSSTSLGVYLIHVQPVFFREVFGKNLRNLTVSEGGGYLCLLIVSTAVIYIACSALDLMRIMIFKGIERFLTIRKYRNVECLTGQPR